MSESAIINDCLHHYTSQHIQLRKDFFDLCAYDPNKYNCRVNFNGKPIKDEPNQECMAKILRLLETLTDSARTEWAVKADALRKQGLNPQEPKEYTVQLSYGFIAQLLYFTHGDSPIRNSIAVLLERNYIKRYQETINSVPFYVLNIEVVQKALRLQAEQSLSGVEKNSQSGEKFRVLKKTAKPPNSTAKGARKTPERPNSTAKPPNSTAKPPNSTPSNNSNTDQDTDKTEEEGTLPHDHAATFALAPTPALSHDHIATDTPTHEHSHQEEKQPVEPRPSDSQGHSHQETVTDSHGYENTDEDTVKTPVVKRDAQQLSTRTATYAQGSGKVSAHVEPKVLDVRTLTLKAHASYIFHWLDVVKQEAKRDPRACYAHTKTAEGQIVDLITSCWNSAKELTEENVKKAWLKMWNEPAGKNGFSWKKAGISLKAFCEHYSDYLEKAWDSEQKSAPGSTSSLPSFGHMNDEQYAAYLRGATL